MTAHLDRGEKHLEAGRLDRAERDFKKALVYDADNLRAVFGLGNTYLTGGKIEEAREIFEKIMSIELAFGPENKFLFNEFGIRMRKAGLLDMARSYYEKALSVAEADENLLFNLGRVYLELGEFSAAIGAAEQALAVDPGFAVADRLKKAAEKAAPKAPGASAPAEAVPPSETPPSCSRK